MADERESGSNGIVPKGPLSGQEFLRVAGLTGVAVGVGGGLTGALAGCARGTTTTMTGGTTETTAGVTTTAGGPAGREIKIGYVSPQTASLPGFGEADNFIIEGVKAALALFVVAADVLKRTTDIDSRDAVVEALRTTNIKSIVGPIDFSAKGPVPNVSKTPLVGGQWGKGTAGTLRRYRTPDSRATALTVTSSRQWGTVCQ